MTPLIALIFSLLVLLNLRRRLTQLIFDLLMSLFGDKGMVGLIYGFLFLPGVLLHESSHWIAAKLLQVRVHRFSLVPTWTDEGTLRFGYVEMSKVDHVRGALVGLAPLALGTLVVLWIALDIMSLDRLWNSLWSGNAALGIEQLKIISEIPDIWLWMYLLVTVSNMMLPSPSDRASWIPVGILILLGFIPLILLRPSGVGVEWVNGIVEETIQSLTTAFGITAVLDLVITLPLGAIGRVARPPTR